MFIVYLNNIVKYVSMIFFILSAVTGFVSSLTGTIHLMFQLVKWRNLKFFRATTLMDLMLQRSLCQSCLLRSGNNKMERKKQLYLTECHCFEKAESRADSVLKKFNTFSYKFFNCFPPLYFSSSDDQGSRGQIFYFKRKCCLNSVLQKWKLENTFRIIPKGSS